MKGAPRKRPVQGDSRRTRDSEGEGARTRRGTARPPSGGARKPRGARSPADQRGEELRIQVYLARAGVASRRASEDLVRGGRVRINDVPAELGQKVTVGQDRVTVDDAPVRIQPVEWVILHKPRGYVTTREDPEGRRTIYDLLPDDLRHLFHVGRLDRDSTGVILLTNEGEMANRLLHPRYGTTKEYIADVTGRPSDDALGSLVSGIQLEDGPAQAIEVEYVKDLDEEGARIRVVLEEGRNREVRRMLEAIGHPVRSLYRRRFGPLTVGRLRRGEWRRLTDAEIAKLREYTL